MNQLLMARSATVTIFTQWVGPNFIEKIVLLFSLTYISLRAGESWNNFHIDFNTLSNFQPVFLLHSGVHWRLSVAYSFQYFLNNVFRHSFFDLTFFQTPTNLWQAHPLTTESVVVLCLVFICIRSSGNGSQNIELLPNTLNHPRILYECLTVHFGICGSYSHQIKERTQVHLLFLS